jgi:hypothetical protein
VQQIERPLRARLAGGMPSGIGGLDGDGDAAVRLRKLLDRERT